jgi:hypothetical protein
VLRVCPLLINAKDSPVGFPQAQAASNLDTWAGAQRSRPAGVRTPRVATLNPQLVTRLEASSVMLSNDLTVDVPAG